MNILQHTKYIMGKYGFKTTKSLGQNFLINESVLNDIIYSSELTKDDIVIEVGTGIGVLTKRLAESSKEVIAIEIDKKVINILEEVLIGNDNVTIINEDILKVDIKKILEDLGYKDSKIKVVANLPYYITTPIIFKFLEEKIKIDSMTLMMQEEVADRINAKPSTKSYGSLSVYLQYFMKSEIVTKVSKDSFYPEPNVNSAVILLKQRDKKIVDIKDEDIFFKIVRGSFAKRRKTILNSLTNYENLGEKEKISSLLQQANIDPQRRGETLTIEEFANLSNTYVEMYK